MVTLQELSLYLNELLQILKVNDYCKNGVQVEGTPKISKIATAVSANLETIEKAVAMKADALIVHHGLFWNSDPHEITGVKKKKLALLLKHDISLLAYHLALDAHKEVGNNWRAAIEMGWTDLEPFGNMNGTYIGVRGKIGKLPVEAFQKILEKYYGQKAHVALFGKKMVETAALISGGAYRSVQEAAVLGIDCFITGNFDEPAWNIAMEEKINFFALGHTATEKIGPRALAELLQQHFLIDATFIDTDNPF